MTSSYQKGFYITALLMLLFGFFMHIDLRMHIISSNGDDFRSLYRGLFALNHGLSTYLENALDLAVKQGRFYFVLTDAVSQFPYLIINDFYRALFLTSLYFSAGVSVATVLWGFFKSEKLSILFILAYVYFVPMYGSWYAYYHWTAYWLTPIVFFGFTFLFHSRLMHKTYTPWLIYMAYFFSCCVSIIFSEMYFIGFGFLIFLNFLVSQKINSSSLFFKNLLSKKLILSALPFIFYLAVYVWFYLTYSSSGSRVGSKLAFSFGALEVWETFATFFNSGLPINHIIQEQSAKAWWLFLAKNPLGYSTELIKYLFVVIVLAAGFTKVSLDKSIDGRSSLLAGGWKKHSSKVMLIVFSGVIFATLQIFTIAYQTWLKDFRPWYTPTFHISLGILAALSFSIVILSEKRLPFERASKPILTIAVMCLFAYGLFTSINSYKHVSTALRGINLELQMLYRLKSLPVLAAIKAGDNVIFPEFKVAAGMDPSVFLSEFYGRTINVKSKYSKSDQGDTYIFRVRAGIDIDDSYLLIGKVDGFDEIKQDYRVDTVFAVPYIPSAKNPRLTMLVGDITGNVDVKLLAPVFVQSFSDYTVAVINGSVLLDSIVLASKRDKRQPYKVNDSNKISLLEWSGCDRKHVDMIKMKTHLRCPTEGIISFVLNTSDCGRYSIGYEARLSGTGRDETTGLVFKANKREQSSEGVLELCPGENEVEYKLRPQLESNGAEYILVNEVIFSRLGS